MHHDVTQAEASSSAQANDPLDRNCVVSAFNRTAWSGIVHDASPARGLASVCRNVDEKSSALLATRLPRGFAADVDTVRELVKNLQFDIPLSFIEDRAEEPISLPVGVGDQTLEEVLRAIVDQHERYRCEVYDDRLVLRSSDSLFDVTVSGVDVVEAHRFPARHAYLELLHAADPRFENWTTLIFMAGDDFSPIFDGRVTLSPRARVVQHLVELLGRNRDLYFDIYASDAWQFIRFGVVLQPWERELIRTQEYWRRKRNPPVAAPLPADEADERQ